MLTVYTMAFMHNQITISKYQIKVAKDPINAACQ